MNTLTTNQVISARIVAKMAEGFDIAQAVDAVLGAGTYMKLATEVWEAARKA